MSGSEYQDEWEQRTGQGFRTQAVTGYEENNSSQFAAFWRKPGVQTAVGDMNGDGAINSFDIEMFVLALTAPETYTIRTGLDIVTGDTNEDGDVNAFDIQAFVSMLTNQQNGVSPVTVARLLEVERQRDPFQLRPPLIEISRPSSKSIRLNWEEDGWKLQGSENMEVWSNLTTATRSYSVDRGKKWRFFRLR